MPRLEKNSIVANNRALYKPILAQIEALKATINMAPKTLREPLLLASTQVLLGLEDTQEVKEILYSVYNIYNMEG